MYEKIAPDFNRKEHQPWHYVVQFLNRLPAGSLVTDIGKITVDLVARKVYKY